MRRMWRIVVLLRAKPHTLEELAKALSVSERTIRRDILALQAVPLPIESRFPPAGTRSPRFGIQVHRRNEWFIRATAEWPEGSRIPVADLPEART
jgi:hypothetical protein